MDREKVEKMMEKAENDKEKFDLYELWMQNKTKMRHQGNIKHRHSLMFVDKLKEKFSKVNSPFDRVEEVRTDDGGFKNEAERVHALLNMGCKKEDIGFSAGIVKLFTKYSDLQRKSKSQEPDSATSKQNYNKFNGCTDVKEWLAK